MKLAAIASCFAVAAAALPTVKVAPRASISKADGTKFNIDGVTKYYAGTNSYWIPFLTSDNDVDVIMGHLKTSGHKILRIWGFNDVKTIPGSGTVYFQSFSGSTATINTGANGLQRLDAVVKAAEKHGIKLIINFVNNWTDYGGMAAYFSACGVSNNAGWYQSTKCQTMYQAYIKAVISRYRTSAAVFAWELANEPRCNGCATSVLTNWIRKTSDYIRSLDSDHMITAGDEGFGLAGDTSYPYGYTEGFDWATNLALPNISFGTFHLYVESWGVGSNKTFGQSWVAAHAAICKKLTKPCLFEEYGVTNAAEHCPVESAWQSASLALKDSGMAGDLFWQLGDTIQSTGQLTHNDGHTIYYGSSDWKCLVDQHVKNIG
ncbi:glycoside hydrolase family 5 protein [Lentithecium fluviatile CBS 122367]|uniref:mannan endo-1,4-beta-mannosidase n=1 Tax=Lentithecium fluviatile CBS 122367 TaxID=1168545 RepID=A0A6G1JHV3_9PLEO|nr:glycoside hydrolase family 5 protein [Lentithecium fluviatile CBS 122367]